MPVSIDEARAQIQTFIASIGGMTAKQKESSPTVQFCERFNTVLELAKEARPQVDARLWPKPFEPYETVGGMMHVETRYSEIESYARQVLANLPGPAPGVYSGR